MTLNWENHRNEDGTIALVAAYQDFIRLTQLARYTNANDVPVPALVFRYLNRVQELYPIKSRQVAALAITHALEIT